MAWLSEIRNIKSDKKEIRKFSLLIGVIVMAVSSFFFFRGKDHYYVIFIFGVGMMLIGLVYPTVLKPMYLIWMSFSISVGFIMTHVILIIIFYVIFTPVGIMMKLLGKDLLDEKINKEASSYWTRRLAISHDSKRL